jgi:hypothetical protein
MTLHDENICYSYCSPSIIRAMKSRTMRWAKLVARMTVAYKVGVEKPESKKILLCRSRIRWEDSSQMDHKRMKIWARIIWLSMGSDPIIQQQFIQTAWNFLTSKVTVAVEERVH